jgi:hypothetical protein
MNYRLITVFFLIATLNKQRVWIWSTLWLSNGSCWIIPYKYIEILVGTYGKIIYKWWIFHCLLWLPEGTSHFLVTHLSRAKLSSPRPQGFACQFGRSLSKSGLRPKRPVRKTFAHPFLLVGWGCWLLFLIRSVSVTITDLYYIV